MENNELIIKKREEIRLLKKEIMKKEGEISQIKSEILQKRYGIVKGNIIRYKNRIGIVTFLEEYIYWKNIDEKTGVIYTMERTLLLEKGDKVIKLWGSYEEYIDDRNNKKDDMLS